jgi:hypothetical protein
MKHNFYNLIFIILFLISLPHISEGKGKDVYMWFDCEANYERLSHPDSIAYYLDKVKAIGVTDVVIDVKSIMGEVLYKSNIAPFMGEWKGDYRSEDYDMLGIFIKEGHKRGIGVHASLNVFSGGHNTHKRGIIYKQHPEWQSQNYWIDKIMPISEMDWNYNGMLNPALPEVQEYELSILKEFVSKHKKLDGIVLDRARYDGITSDFSQKSKEMFEAYSGISIENFPNDILFWEKDKKGTDIWKPGKHFNKWIEWRTSVITGFFEKAHSAVKKINKNILFGDYTGAWYPVYYELGVNWASKTYDPSKEYNWATAKYKDFGYAELLDVYMSGLYFTEVTIAEVEKMNEEAMKNRTEAAMGKGKEYWYSVEGSAKLAKEVTNGVVPVTGSIYVEQYGDVKLFQRAVAKAIECTDGLMIFDVVHIINHNWWNELGEAVKEGQNR